MDSVNSNSTSDGESTDFEEGNGEEGKERSKRSTGEDDLNFIPENGDDSQPPHYDNYYQIYNDYNHHHPYHYPYRHIYLDPYDKGVKNYKNYLHHKYVNEKYP